MDPRRAPEPPLDPTIDIADPADADLSAVPGDPLIGGAPPPMSTPPPMPTTTSTPTGDEQGTAGRVKDAATSAAGDVASTATDQAKQVASEAKVQVKSVLEDTKGQVSGLVGQARDELKSQASDRSTQAADGLRTLSGQLQALREGRADEAGPLAGYLDQARDQVSSFASRLDEGGIDGLVDDVSRFARQRPIVFLAAAAGAGFLVGRLVRSGVSVAKDGGDDTATVNASTRPAPELLPPPTPLTTGMQVS